MNRIAMKITEEALDVISEFTGASIDVFGDNSYILFSIISVDPFEFNAKFMNEEEILDIVKEDSNVHILSL